MPHIDVPDATAQATIYSSGLHEHLKAKLEGRLDRSKRHDVKYLITHMLELESANVTARLLLGKPFCCTHATTGDANKSSVALQLKRKAAGHSSPSQTTQVSEQKPVSEKRKASKKLVAVISQHASNERLGAPQPDEQLQRLRESAALL